MKLEQGHKVMTAPVFLEYVGPDREESPVFGTLVRGERYQAEAGFGQYLLDHHPTHWTRPGPVTPAEAPDSKE